MQVRQQNTRKGWPPRPPAPAEAAPCPSITAGRPPLRVGTDGLADAGTAGLTHRHSDPVLTDPHNTEHVFLGFHLNFKIKAMDYQHGVRSQTRYFDERLSDGVPLGLAASRKGARALRWDGRPGLGRSWTRAEETRPHLGPRCSSPASPLLHRQLCCRRSTGALLLPVGPCDSLKALWNILFF